MIKALFNNGDIIRKKGRWKSNEVIGNKIWKALLDKEGEQKIIKNMDNLGFTRKLKIDSFVFNNKLIKLKEVYDVPIGYTLFKRVKDGFALVQVQAKTLNESRVGTNKNGESLLPFLFTENFKLINHI